MVVGVSSFWQSHSSQCECEEKSFSQHCQHFLILDLDSLRPMLITQKVGNKMYNNRMFLVFSCVKNHSHIDFDF
jgi:hypothetical protein